MLFMKRTFSGVSCSSLHFACHFKRVLFIRHLLTSEDALFLSSYSSSYWNFEAIDHVALLNLSCEAGVVRYR